MPQIHPTAIVEPGASVAPSAKIGPYCVVGPKVELGEKVELISHVAVAGRTSVGEGTRIFPFASIGHQPQDLKYKGEESRLVIGRNNIIREHVTMNPGTSGGGMVTKVGDFCLFMVGVHVAHDCILGNHVIMANNATLAGHVVIEDHVTLGAFCPVHQHCTVGAYSFIGGGTIVTQDVLPFSLTSCRRENRAFGINKIGLERRGFSADRLKVLQKAYRLLLAAKLNTTQALEKMRQLEGEDVAQLVKFIEGSKRGVIK